MLSRDGHCTTHFGRSHFRKAAVQEKVECAMRAMRRCPERVLSTADRGVARLEIREDRDIVVIEIETAIGLQIDEELCGRFQPFKCKYDLTLNVGSNFGLRHLISYATTWVVTLLYHPRGRTSPALNNRSSIE